MKNENKGITLIALIITVVVLLILAAVTISAVNEGGIFAHANNAATKYNSAATLENTLVTNYLSEMGKWDNGSGSSGGTGGSGVGEISGDFTYTSSGSNGTITGLSPEGLEKLSSGQTTTITIPSEITDGENTYTVTEIAANAFLNCTNLNELFEDEEAEPIYRTADYDKITSIVIPNTVTTIGDLAFTFSKASINIPNTVTTIGNVAFAYCEGVNISQLPNSITTIGDLAFYASGMTSFTIQNELSGKNINWGDVLSGRLQNITIDINNIGDEMFKGSELGNITIGENVKTIGEHAFQKANNKYASTTITFLGRPTSIADGAFDEMGDNKTYIVPWKQANKFANEPWDSVMEGDYVRIHYSDMAEGTYHYFKGGE